MKTTVEARHLSIKREETEAEVFPGVRNEVPADEDERGEDEAFASVAIFEATFRNEADRRTDLKVQIEAIDNRRERERDRE